VMVQASVRAQRSRSSAVRGAAGVVIVMLPYPSGRVLAGWWQDSGTQAG
jgi:hypothetical protein